MTIAVCILAKNESSSIGPTLAQLANQTLLKTSGGSTTVHVVANGCTDDTAAAAERSRDLLAKSGTALKSYDLHPGGKSRAWNRMVHDLAEPDTDFFIFCDADIEFVDERVLEEMLAKLKRRPDLEVCTGYPLKDATAKPRKNVYDKLSLALSRETRHINAIAGSLYIARAEALRAIWLPNETPAEDGFLNAMLNTDGFSQKSRPRVIEEHDRPTHYYEQLDPVAFIAHERRLIVGTIINRWIFEHLWSLSLTSPAGPLIDQMNHDDPDWVERIIRERSQAKSWLIPNAILFARLTANQNRALWRRLAFFPLALAGTMMTILPAVSANRRLKAAGASSVW
ncbi:MULTISPECIES: glycosyltransferase family 2 protein [Sphingomonas]|uniref:glycosyltransferase family 2 protein n=1 Tax=Sphingomonas TaxID=13687 RepID=UPI0013B455BA|nr:MULTISPECIES: glycosyltransferase [Sphingomonas]